MKLNTPRLTHAESRFYLVATVLLSTLFPIVASAASSDLQFKYDAAGHLIAVFNLSTDPQNCNAEKNVCPTPTGYQDPAAPSVR